MPSAHWMIEPVPSLKIERDGAREEGGDGGGFLVVENFDIGQAGAVVDRDMHELPAEIVALGVVALRGAAAGHLVAGAADLAELLDVDVDELAGPGALVAFGWLHSQPAELAHPHLLEQARDRGEGHAEHSGILRADKSQPPKRRDRLPAVF